MNFHTYAMFAEKILKNHFDHRAVAYLEHLPAMVEGNDH